MNKSAYQMLLWLLLLIAVYPLCSQTPGWRLQQSIFYNDPFIMEATTQHAIYTYNDAYPGLVDSVFYGAYNNEYGYWIPQSYELRQYNPANMLITAIEVFQYNPPGGIISRITAEYDTQGRLIHKNEFRAEDGSTELNPSYRWHYYYENNALSETCLYVNSGTTYDNYFHQVYETDAQGRIIASIGYSSPDSLNWVARGRQYTTYHASDTLTGIGYISNMAKTLDFTIYARYPYNLQQGKITQKINQEYTSDIWVNMHNYVEEYNENNLPASYITQYWVTGHWDNVSKDMYYFDVNENLDHYDTYSFQNGEWTDILQRVAFNWEQYTATEDDVLPGVALNLSAYPNPFASSVNITLQSKSNAPVKASIYNIKGQLIKALGNSKSLIWEGTDSNNQPVSNGIYFVKAEQDGKTVTGKVIRIK